MCTSVWLHPPHFFLPIYPFNAASVFLIFRLFSFLLLSHHLRVPPLPVSAYIHLNVSLLVVSSSCVYLCYSLLGSIAGEAHRFQRSDNFST